MRDRRPAKQLLLGLLETAEQLSDAAVTRGHLLSRDRLARRQTGGACTDTALWEIEEEQQQQQEDGLCAEECGPASATCRPAGVRW